MTGAARLVGRSAARAAWPLALCCAAVLWSCGGDSDARRAAADASTSEGDAGDAEAGDGHPSTGMGSDGAGSDGAGSDGGGRPVGDASAADAAVGPLSPDPKPTSAMPPVPGELSIHQLDLPVGLVPKLGEAAILVGPTGELTLLDIGNTKHDDEVREAVEALNTQWLTPARGYPRQRGKREVEWVVLTHFHGDHIGAAESLLSGKGALSVTRGVVFRGHVDLGEGANLNRWEELCQVVAKLPAARRFPLCTAASVPPCDQGKLKGAYPAVACAGLRRGKLDDPSDDATPGPGGKLGAPSWLDLGGGARLTLVAANARCTGPGDAETALSFGHDEGNEENGRSLVGLVSYGAFRYHFGGDLTGSGKPGEPDVESALAQTSGPRFWAGPGGKALGVDVVHAHHHARKTSSNATFVAAVAPKDGLGRNVVAGINSAYLGSPNDAVVARFASGGRLGAGHFWVTKTTVGGMDASDDLIVADGEVRVRTFAKGAGYRVQAWGGKSKHSQPYAALRSGQQLSPAGP